MEAFAKASNEGTTEKLLAGTECLTPSCVTLASAFFESITYAQDVQL
jgi:hypothetical protein